MNIKDLSKIDIKELKYIDWRSVKSRLLSQPMVIIHIVMAIVTVYIIFYSFRTLTTMKKTLEEKVPGLRQKSESLDKLELKQKDYREFLTNIPKLISDAELIKALSEAALKRDVQIVSFLPTEKKETMYFRLANVKIIVSSKSYANIVRFMHDIENFPYSTRIKRWSGVSVGEMEDARQRSRRYAQATNDVSVEQKHTRATVEIESVEFKND